MENIFVNLAAWTRSFLEGLNIDSYFTDLSVLFVHIIGIIAFIFANALVLVLMERKVAAYFQERLGPNRIGPWGIFQTVIDTVKLMGKELILPKHVDKWTFLLAPILIFVPPVLLFAVVPFGKNMVSVDLNIGIFYILAVASLSTIPILMAGWSSNNKYSLIGGMRAVAQMISYEMPMVLGILGVVMITGSLKMSDIVSAQSHVWFIFLQPVAFLIYFIAATAETNRAPFDLVEAEQELVAGAFTEYSGMYFALFFLAEYANLVVVSSVAATLFLGGWQAPFGLTFIPSWIWFVGKVYFMIFLFMWIRWTYPRLRVDNLMHLGWKVLFPLSLANIFVTGVGVYLYRMLGW
ncbi:NADH-quinone oxidoreductase subunit NuoH [Candidatus Formimonas warabiya]|uniref:NADH-quinone oxidoreductase subunit H n=1 Tax=Formimonas warabiya TaxID=1761012 RepID=A0A3G1KZS2_FORW1|nr:NADH-quinone oxidoreductase subunit NuoH [Candidatus Formimonas warabiya]ATW28033.1 NADH-quinone oxidoreductase subunit H [Candidatus Formimonas warabiya]